MNRDFLVLLDAGHGGLDPSGKYVSAPSKQFKHKKGVFHGDGWFFEGVWNRTMVNAVAEKLRHLGIPHVLLSHHYLDLSLEYRAQKANWYHRHFSQSVLISSHANASVSNDGRGFEVYTTPGITQSDLLAQMLWNHVQELLGKDLTLRSDLSDNDHDKEANFYILRKTSMPAILIEHLFFDNFEDATLLMDGDIVERFAEAQVRTVLDYFSPPPVAV